MTALKFTRSSYLTESYRALCRLEKEWYLADAANEDLEVQKRVELQVEFS